MFHTKIASSIFMESRFSSFRFNQNGSNGILHYCRDALAQADLRWDASGFFFFPHLHQAAVFVEHVAEKWNRVCIGKNTLLHPQFSPILQNSCSSHGQCPPGLEAGRWQRAAIMEQMCPRSQSSFKPSTRAPDTTLSHTSVIEIIIQNWTGVK